MLFSEIFGLEPIKKTLIGSVNKGHVAHAQLFVGKSGSGSLALALAYAQYINCEDKQENESCGRCSSCIQYKKLVHPDLHFVFPMANIEKVKKEDLRTYLLPKFREFLINYPYGTMHTWSGLAEAENKQFNIAVEEGRNIIQAISLKAYQAEYKVVIFWMPEYMNIAMANAILKVLEEPPAKTLFLLIASDYEKLLPTIISRCQLIHIPAFEKDDVKKYLLTKNLCDETMASRIMKIADGDMDKAVQLCSSYNHDELELFSKWMRLCFGRKYLEMVPFVDDISKIGREKQKNLMLFGIQLLRDSLMQKQELAELIHRDEEELKFIQNFSKALSDKVIAELSELLSETYVHIERNGNAKIIFMDTSIKLGNCFARK